MHKLSLVAVFSVLGSIYAQAQVPTEMVGEWCSRLEGGCFQLYEDGRLTAVEETDKVGTWTLKKDVLELQFPERPADQYKIWRVDNEGMLLGLGDGFWALSKGKPQKLSGADKTKRIEQLLGKWSVDSLIGVPQEGFLHDRLGFAFELQKKNKGRYTGYFLNEPYEAPIQWELSADGSKLIFSFLDKEQTRPPLELGLGIGNKGELYLSMLAMYTYGEFIARRLGSDAELPLIRVRD